MEKVYEVLEVEETKVENKKKNKGFSLVELIIVIAIMAILVGVVGTQVLPYIEKSREARDQQVMSSICTAALTAFSQNAASLTSGATYTIVNFGDGGSGTTAAPDAVKTALTELTGYDSLTDVISDFDSKKGAAIDTITIQYVANTGEVTVTPADTATTGAVDVSTFVITAK